MATLLKFRFVLELRMHTIKYVQESPFEIQTLVLWNLIGHSTTGPLSAARVIAHQYCSATFLSLQRQIRGFQKYNFSFVTVFRLR